MRLRDRKVIAIDLDGTLCDELPYGIRPLAEPFLDKRDLINKWVDKGHIIIIFTARPWHEYFLIQKWLDDNEFKYNQIVCGKVQYDYIIDDRMSTFTEVHHRLLED